MTAMDMEFAIMENVNVKISLSGRTVQSRHALIIAIIGVYAKINLCVYVKKAFMVIIVNLSGVI